MPVACCFLCGESFGVSSSLNRHLKEVHNHENVQKEKCSQCEYVGKHRLVDDFEQKPSVFFHS